MKPHSNRFHLLVAAATAAVTISACIATVVLAQRDGPADKNSHPAPWLNPTKQQAEVDAAHAANTQLLHDFVARRDDPHTLPTIWVQSWAMAPARLEAAAKSAATIVYGTVDSVTFAANPSGGMPLSTATVRVIEVVKGQLPPQITIDQMGGPVAHPPSGALAQFEMAPLILPGDEVVLLLQRDAPDKTLCQVYGAGAFFVNHGHITGKSAERYHIAGQTLEHLLHTLATAG